MPDRRSPVDVQAAERFARLAADGLWWNAQFVDAFRDPVLNQRIMTALLAYADGSDEVVDPD